MQLQAFNDLLIDLLGGVPFARPFVCDGNPLHCELFIVGFNAATRMQVDFWNFWSVGNGFDKQSWFDAYCLERASRPLKKGKLRRNRVSSTRQRIEWIVSAASPVSCLETNLYAKATPEAKDLGKKDRDSSIFEFLLQQIKPKVVFLHGKDARKHISEMAGQEIDQGVVTDAEVFGSHIKVLAMPHLSRGWSKQKSSDVGRQLKTLCQQNS